MDPAMARMLAAARGGRPGEAPPAPGADAPVPDKYGQFEFRLTAHWAYIRTLQWRSNPYLILGAS